MNIQIDGRAIAFEGKPTILDVARANGVFIPSLCDHPRLDPFAACRICLVEIKGRNGYVPACSTPAEDGLEVATATPALVDLRRRILELILAEHPNACLICAEKNSCDEFKSTLHKTGEVNGCVFCPANGRCELQRVVEAVAVERVHFPSERRPGEVRRDDPFIDRDNNLCILCGRCVRICHEIRGASVLTFVARGSSTVIGTALDRRLLDSACQFCGACVDVCPTGSLSERAVRYERLPDKETRTICPFCGQGCGLKIGSRGDKVVGAVPDPDGPANRGQACVKGRFLMKHALNHPDRIRRPMIRRDGRLQETTWEDALNAAAERLRGIGAGSVFSAFSGQVSCEDLFVLHRFAAEVLKVRGTAGPWIGSAAGELRELCRSSGYTAPLNFRLSDIGRGAVILLIGEDVTLTQPIVGVTINQAAKNGAEVISVGSEDARLARNSSIRLTAAAGCEGTLFSALSEILLRAREENAGEPERTTLFRSRLGAVDLAGASRALRIDENRLAGLARALETRSPVFFLFGPGLLKIPGGRNRLRDLWYLAALAGGRVLALDKEANLRGGLEIAGAFPIGTISGDDLEAAASEDGVHAIYVAGGFPNFKRGGAEFVIVQGSYMDENSSAADIVLPETTSFEADGTFVNIEGRVQISNGAVQPRGEARPGWAIVSELAAKMGGIGFDFSSAADVRKDLARAIPSFAALAADEIPPEGVFLAETEAREGFFIGGETLDNRLPGYGPPISRGADDYKGLDLALKNKSLKLIRGR